MSSPALDMPTPEKTGTPDLELIHPDTPASLRVLTPGARAFLAELATEFTERQRELLEARQGRQAGFDAGALPDFDPATADIREGDWRVAPIPVEVRDRRTEITGPVSRKMVVNALNSGAQVYMADFEDSTSPTWHAVMDGQVNLMDAIRREIDFSTPAGKHYALNDDTAVLMVRPRGLHLPTRHLRVNGKPIPGSLVDFGLYLYHNAEALWDSGSRPYLYLPKLEHYSEAQYWDDVISWSEARLGLERGTVKVTVLIETLPAVFQMHEILHALKDRILGLNCGRWDYIFSYIKTLRAHPDRILPDRGEVTMGVPFMSAYSRLLVQTCHRRGAFAMGGMAAQIPIKGDDAANEAAMEKVRADKIREVMNGHDGTWVAHPGLERLARAEFDKVMTGPNQIDTAHPDETITAEQLLAPCEGGITEDGIRHNIRVSILYLAAWMDGNGCVPIDHLMEDAATAEIGRAQLWQWSHHGAETVVGTPITSEWIDELFSEEHAKLLAAGMNGHTPAINKATALLRQMTQRDVLEDFLTLPAYPHLVA
ncbi:MAG: malate synthase A [Pseudomonadota bacterium]